MLRKTFTAVAFGLLLTVGLALTVVRGRQPVMAAPAARPDVRLIHVAITGADEPDCGDTAAPCASIQHALAVAGDGDVIQVAQGAYSGTLVVTASVQLLGGFEAVAWTRDIAAYTTVISGNQAGPVVRVSGSSTATIEGFDIVAGAAPEGAGVTIEQAAPTIANCRIHDNRAENAGGGIYVTGAAAPTIISNTLWANTAATGGGIDIAGGSTGVLRGNAIHHNRATLGGGVSLRENSAPQVERNTISDNVGSDGGGVNITGASPALTDNLITRNVMAGYRYGAGLYIGGGASPTVLSNTISANTANYGWGGGVYIASGAPTLAYNEIANNSAGNPSYPAPDGGGIHIECQWCSGIVIRHNTIRANSASNQGGGIFAKSYGEISDNLIEGNSARVGGGIGLWGSSYKGAIQNNSITGNDGGGIYMYYGANPTLISNRITANSAAIGGGLRIEGGARPVLTNNVVADNQASEAGAGAYVAGATAQLLHTTLARNGAEGSGLYVTSNSTVSLKNTILVSQTTGITVSAGSSVSLEGVLWFANGLDTGGAGTIAVAQDLQGDPAFAADGYHITAASAARDRGIDVGVTTDIDGAQRPVGALPDLGAHEYPVTATGARPVTPTVTISTVPGTLDIRLSWNDDPANCGYEIHRATAPYFTLSAATHRASLPAGSTSYRDQAAIGWVGTDYFYVVRATDCAGSQRADARPVGAFDFALGSGVVYRLHGLAFSPYTGDQSPDAGAQVSESQLRTRMAIVAPYTQRIRTYGCGNGLEIAGRVAHDMGLEAAVGAWLGGDPAVNALQMQCLIGAARAGDVDLAIVGNETLLLHDQGKPSPTEEELLGYIAQFRQAAPRVPVATADTYDQWLAHPAVVAAVDVILAHYYPYWQGIALDQTLAALDNGHQQVVALAGSKPVIVAETGWPSGGDPQGAAIPSPENAAAYFVNFISWARAKNVSYYYFDALDESWKENLEGAQGAHWGIWDKEGNLKPGMRDVFDGRTVPDNWSAGGRRLRGQESQVSTQSSRGVLLPQ